MKNWTIKEAVEVIKAAGDAEAIKEIARINPLFVVAVAKDDISAVANMMGEKFTVRKLESGAAAETEEEAESTTESAEVEAPKKKTAPAKAEPVDDTNLESLTTKQLMQLCDKRGIKVPHYGKNKQFYIEQLQGAGSAAEEEQPAEAEEADAYEGKSPVELYKMCKKRGIKVEQKKPAKVYIAALKKADAEAAKAAEAESDDDDWGEEPEEAPAPKKAEKPAKSASKKAAPKVEEPEEEDDGDDWDI